MASSEALELSSGLAPGGVLNGLAPGCVLSEQQQREKETAQTYFVDIWEGKAEANKRC